MALAAKTAKELFVKRGIDNVKMLDVAKESGLGVASLYRAFGTKDALVIDSASLFWKEIKAEYLPRLDTPSFKKKSGIEQIGVILDIYSELLQYHEDFLRFLGDFDSYCIRHSVPSDMLYDYEKAMSDFYAPYLCAVEKGSADGTVYVGFDPYALYLTLNHTLISFLQKVVRGKVVSRDVRFSEEFSILKSIIYNYFKTSQSAEST